MRDGCQAPLSPAVAGLCGHRGGRGARYVLHAAKLVALAALGRSTTRQAAATRSDAPGATERHFAAASHVGRSHNSYAPPASSERVLTRCWTRVGGPRWRPSRRAVAQPCRLAAKELRQAAAHSHKRTSSSAVQRMVMRLEYGGASLLCAGHEAEREEIPPNRKRAPADTFSWQKTARHARSPPP